MNGRLVLNVGLSVVLNAALAIVLVAIVAAGWLLRADSAKPNFEFMPDMAHSARYNAYAANPVFADGQTLQAPPPGTIPRGDLPLHYAATAQDALRAGEELANPVPLDNANAQQRGATVFTNFCAECHGPDGRGMGPIAQRGFPPPPSLFADRALKLKDGQMFHILTYGQNNMPSYASQISRQDRWNVIVYLRSLQRASSAPQPARAVAGGTP